MSEDQFQNMKARKASDDFNRKHVLGVRCWCEKVHGIPIKWVGPAQTSGEIIEDVARMIWSFNLENRPMKRPDMVDIWTEEDEKIKHTYRLIAELAVKIARREMNQ